MADTQSILQQVWQDPLVQSLQDAWQQGHVNLVGAVDSQKACLLAALLQGKQGSLGTGRPTSPLCLVVADELALRRFESAFQAFWPSPERLAVFRRRDLALTRTEAQGREAEFARLAVLRRLLLGEVDVLIVQASALLQRLPDVALFQELTLHLKWGEQQSPEALAEHLEQIGYERCQQAQMPGQYARRGDILDVVPIGLEANKQLEAGTLAVEGGIGYRLSFFDDEIDQLKVYDLNTQRSLERCEEVIIAPAKERLYGGGITRQSLAAEIHHLGHSHLKQLGRQQIERPILEKLEDLLQADVKDFKEGTEPAAYDAWLSLLKAQANILDYAQAVGARFAIDELMRCRSRMDQTQAEFHERCRKLLEKGQAFPHLSEAQLDVPSLLKQIDELAKVLAMASIGAGGNGLPKGLSLQVAGREVDSYRGREIELGQLIQERQRLGLATWVATSVNERAERLKQILLEQEVPVLVQIWPRALARGFEWPSAKLLVLGTEEVFGVERTRRARRFKGAKIDFFADLKPGEKVVHEGYGIGIYEGLVTQQDKQGAKKDFLAIRYADEDRLYLPMEQLDQIQRYIGSEGKEAKLTRLGTAEWSRLKERTRQSLKTLATDLVALYAERSVIKGHAFSPENDWDRDFAESFPYEETEDQLRAIAEISRDMEAPKVMDRLLCGDVGFGKTEVAFRAMFKCVGDGYQAMLLAPTTVLAQQHYQTFLQRIQPFPVKAALLNRFVSPEKQKQVLRGLANGSIDVVIGTHRLLSKDLQCKKLGLLVVDEEQRFGVDHKEQIKALNPTLDVLTLSATPIPRTLHMSLSGIRDISVLEEAPEDRRPVQTYVMEYDEAVVDDAILRELGRGGQVFYLYNDTRRISERAAQIAERLPGARVGYAHGRMSEQQLDDTIQAFLAGEIEILVCTTIIESGIDMPNVNTIIVERAERFGLAQLYQLRGRVGRSRRQAYAYITYRRDQVLSEVAEKRLTAIRDFTELGSGFRIALRDLEVRGAGNLLGAEQHGQMEAVGYDLYTRMLEEEIQKAKQEQGPDLQQLLQGQLASQTGEGGAWGQNRPSFAVEGVRRLTSSGEAQMGEGATLSEAELAQKQLEAERRLLLEYQASSQVNCLLDLSLDSYLPKSYISDDGERMDLYRRISKIQSVADYRDVIDELSDRYGEAPEACLTLCDVALARQVAGRLGITHIYPFKDQLRLQLTTEGKPDMPKLLALLDMPQYKGQLLFNAGLKPFFIWRQMGLVPSKIPAKLRQLFMDLERHLQNEYERLLASQKA